MKRLKRIESFYRLLKKTIHLSPRFHFQPSHHLRLQGIPLRRANAKAKETNPMDQWSDFYYSACIGYTLFFKHTLITFPAASCNCILRRLVIQQRKWPYEFGLKPDIIYSVVHDLKVVAIAPTPRNNPRENNTTCRATLVWLILAKAERHLFSGPRP